MSIAAPMLDALAAGFRECKQKRLVGPKLELDSFLDGMLRSRISRRCAPGAVARNPKPGLCRNHACAPASSMGQHCKGAGPLEGVGEEPLMPVVAISHVNMSRHVSCKHTTTVVSIIYEVGVQSSNTTWLGMSSQRLC